MAKNKTAAKAAKANKRKNRPKLDAKTRRSRHIQSAVTDIYNRLYFTGSSTSKGVKCHNLGRLSSLLAGQDFLIGEHLINDKLRTEDTVWNLWIGVFSDDGDEIWCDPLMIDSEPCTVKDFDEFVNPLIVRHIQSVYTQQEKEYGEVFAKGYGWVATPNETCDLEASEDNFVPWFINRDVLNEERRSAIFNGEDPTTVSPTNSVADTLFGGREHILIEGERRYTKLKRTLGVDKVSKEKPMDSVTAELKSLMGNLD